MRRFDDNGDAGRAYLFETATGAQIAKLLADDGAADDRFGRSVAISGNTAIVGAAYHEEFGHDLGAAYLFDISDPANPTQLFKLLADDGAGNDHFGNPVAISGAIAIIAAPYDDDNGGDSGSAYLFDAAVASPCPWDLDSDGAVGTGDLILLLGSWGDPYGTADLIELLSNWGPCV